MCVWGVCGVCRVCVGCVRGVCGMCVVCVWCVCGVCGVCVGCVQGVCEVCVQHVERGVCGVCARCVQGVCGVCAGCGAVLGDVLYSDFLSQLMIRKQKLEDSLAYHQFKVDADEEESWISEKVAVSTNKELGENMATNQGLLKKQEAFDADLDFHRGQVEKIEFCGNELISQVLAPSLGHHF